MIINKIADELSVQPSQVTAAVKLDEGSTVPLSRATERSDTRP